jgi:ribosomal protein S12 methylthiotransferase
LGVFTYSREDGTSCFSLGDPVKEIVKTKRREKIMEIQAEISWQENKKYLDRQVDVLIEGTSNQSPDLLVGRGKFQAPEVDGVIFMEGPADWPKLVNTIQMVEITGWDVYDLYGKAAR